MIHLRNAIANNDSPVSVRNIEPRLVALTHKGTLTSETGKRYLPGLNDAFCNGILKNNVKTATIATIILFIKRNK